ncbi:hypothetical protein ACPXB5_11395 [Micromonospora arida]|uniref:recombination directionality factor n=1 Tax=Micromonospora arida TaxID=2203715 RepID=UPI003CF5A7AE
MGLRIFETDPEAAPKPRQFSSDVVGRFRSGYQVNKRPMSLPEWRVTSGDPDVMTAVIDLMGSKNNDPAQEWETAGEDNLEVFTETPRVRIVIASAKSLRQEMILRGMKGIIRRCDGVEQKDERGNPAGKGCECPQSFAERKAASKDGSGCDPEVVLFFKLYDNPDLGVFKFRTGSWSFVRDLARDDAPGKLAEIDGPAEAYLGLEVVEFESNGQARKFTKPTLDIIGPAPEPVA